ncbi:fibronectin type III domain-containing protein 7-like [Gambusia affinis]|uniref:fibronectin type III domain-containing protein 7-like n=1 Tax=Gambusia affinis TaxID=33528 RepID=UPI001CDB5FD5|nr:fibronectin type III domain-containing protein 7-like [Gambusia affinis]
MGAMKWLVFLAFLNIHSQAAAQSVIQVSVFSTTSKTVILRWSSYSGATSYKVSTALSSSPNNPIAFVMFGPNTVMGSISSLSQDVTYTFTVEALSANQAVLSSGSTKTSTAPDMMDPIRTVKPKDSSTLMVDFNPKTGATSYVIRVENTNGFFREDSASSSPAEIKNLNPYTEYQLSIMAVNDAGRSQPSSHVEAKTLLPPPQLSTSSPSNDSIIVTWAPVSDAVLYTVFMYKFASNTLEKYNTTNTNLTVTGLDAGSLYVIKSLAWDPEGRDGEESLYVNQTTRPPTPSSVNVSVVRSNSLAGLAVSWKLSQNVYDTVDYHVTSDQNLNCNSTSSSCTLSPVGCGQVHTVYVTASNKAGPSHPSSPVVFITFPCPPESLTLVESSEGNCTLTWNTVPYADGYEAFVKKGDGGEATCNSTRNNCTYQCQCGYTYLMSVLAYNLAGSSPEGTILNYTTGNHACKSHTKDTAPCMPTDLVLDPKNSSVVSVSWKPNNRAANYTVSAESHGEYGQNVGRTCTTSGNGCDITELPCGSSFKFSVMATGGARRSLPSFSTFLETDPCCPVNLTVDQVTQAMSNVSWSHAKAAQSFITSLTSQRGHARCHTQDSHCLMGCITCGTNYTVTVETFSTTGRATNCTYQGFSSSPCCPSGIKLYMLASNSLRVYWRSTASSHSTTVEMLGTSSNYTCTASAGENSCIVENIQCGDVYRLVVAPLTAKSSKVPFCPYRLYSVTCLGSNVGTVIYRGKRSVD